MGGMMSVIQRVQTTTPESDASTDLWALSQAETAVFFAPVTGLIFAFVLSLFFAGGVLNGSLFPDLKEVGTDWYLAFFNGKTLAVWLLWAFVAGFCERLVPDALDNLAKQQSDNSARTTPPTGVRNLTPQNPGQAIVHG
jgi:ABC-type Na+ efflux pump permease subunit